MRFNAIVQLWKDIAWRIDCTKVYLLWCLCSCAEEVGCFCATFLFISQYKYYFGDWRGWWWCCVTIVYCSSWEKPLSPPQIIIKDSLLPKFLNFVIAARRATRRAYLYFVSLSFLLRHFMCRFMFKFSGCVINLIYEIVYLAIHTKSCLMYDVLKKD